MWPGDYGYPLILNWQSAARGWTAPNPLSADRPLIGMRIQNASLSSRCLFLLVTFALVRLAVACGDEQPESALAIPTKPAAVAISKALATPTEAVEQRASESSTPRSSATVASGSDGYDSNAVMYEIFPDAIYATGTDVLNAALAKIQARQDLSLVPVLVETLEYYGGSARRSIADVLQELTGQDISTSPNKWMEWLGRNLSDYRPPKDYAEWKTGLLSVIDLRYAGFHCHTDTHAYSYCYADTYTRAGYGLS